MEKCNVFETKTLWKWLQIHKSISMETEKKIAENTIHKIRDPRIRVIKKEAFQVFYTTLYSVPGGSVTQIDSFLNSPVLDEEQNQAMIAHITEKELEAAITRLKLGKSLRSDDYTAEWYKKFKKDNTCSPSCNELEQRPHSWKEAIISVIQKEGKDKMEYGSIHLVCSFCGL